jgi:uncharacterized protein (TIGR02145 family)
MKKLLSLIALIIICSCSKNSDGNGNSTPSFVPGPDVTDIDGNIYNSVVNCGLTFTKQNLNVSKYNDGTPIPQITPTQWESQTTGAWCYYNNSTTYGTTYGKLYNWYAVAGIYDAASASNPALRKKLAPVGWHIPTDNEWSNLINCLDPNADGGFNIPNLAGGKMKSTGTSLWQSPNTGATNSSGFTGLPAGFQSTDGLCYDIGVYSYWWTSSESNIHEAFYVGISFGSDAVDRWSLFKESKFSVRCVKD